MHHALTVIHHLSTMSGPVAIRASHSAPRGPFARSIGALAVLASLLLAACGSSDSEPSGGARGAPGDGAVAIEVRAAADTPQSGGGSAIPGLWLLAVQQRTLAAAGARTPVEALRGQGAEVVRTDRRGRATLRCASGRVAICDLGSSDAPSPVAVAAGCLRIMVKGGQTLRLTSGEAGLSLAP